MGEGVETAELQGWTSKASRNGAIDTPHGQSDIHIQGVWVGSRELSKNPECHLIQY